MRNIRIGKVTLNIGVGGPGENMEKALKLLKAISGAKPVQTTASDRIPGWGVRPGLPLGAKVTLRYQKGEQLLKRLLVALENKIPEKKFDKFGNFSFGIKEYLEINEMNYDAEIGIIGLEVAVTLERPGFNIKHKRNIAQVGKKHRISKEEAIKFMQDNYEVKIISND